MVLIDIASLSSLTTRCYNGNSGLDVVAGKLQGHWHMFYQKKLKNLWIEELVKDLCLLPKTYLPGYQNT